jgi:2-dehydro-3-deoxy-D-gluconate 5-dehydrogenase
MSKGELFDLNGKVAVVTGGNGGLGRGIALGLARAGAAIAVLGRNEAKNSAVLEELRDVGVPCMAVTVDLTRRDELAPALGAVEGKLQEETGDRQKQVTDRTITYRFMAHR